ncbi:phosphotransferase family protein [Nonomuraea sp. NPDC050451]|uniref:phosphotransferase family protein n=1 Tax=Nonomuraea sp. NPDC050451 TaxID=3364364 RepID=UPI0037AE805B
MPAGELLEIADALLPGHSLDSARVTEGNRTHPRNSGCTSEQAAVVGGGDAAPHGGVAGDRRRRAALRGAGAAHTRDPVRRYATVAVSWIDGEAQPEGQGDPDQIGKLLRAVREVPVTPRLRQLLNAPREKGWAEVLAGQVVPHLPDRWRDECRRRLEAASALEAVSDAVVHGDLGGTNVHWGRDGKLIGVLDWDQAHLFDSAIDAALMAWRGWDTIRMAVDAETYRRARAYDAPFGVGHLVGILDGRPLTNVEGYVRSIVAWLETSA